MAISPVYQKRTGQNCCSSFLLPQFIISCTTIIPIKVPSLASVHFIYRPYQNPYHPIDLKIQTKEQIIKKKVQKRNSYLTSRGKLQGPKRGLQIGRVVLQVEESTGDRGLQLGRVLPRRRVVRDLVESSHDCRCLGGRSCFCFLLSGGKGRGCAKGGSSRGREKVELFKGGLRSQIRR